MSSYTEIIYEQECIGDSLIKINNNFANLDNTLGITAPAYYSLSAAYTTLLENSASYVVLSAIDVDHLQTFLSGGGINAVGPIVSAGIDLMDLFTTNQESINDILNYLATNLILISSANIIAGLNIEGDLTGNTNRVALNNSTAPGLYSFAAGAGSVAAGDYSFAEGGGTAAAGPYSHAEGSTTLAQGAFSHAEGAGTIAQGNYSHAAGTQIKALHNRTWAWKGSENTDYTETTRTGQFMVSAEGGSFFVGNVGINTDSITNGLTIVGGVSSYNGVAAFNTATATGSQSFACGVGTVASGEGSHAEGLFSYAQGAFSHVEGANNVATGNYSHAEGSNTNATADYSHTEGVNTQALGPYSHAEGRGSLAYGSQSHAEGEVTSASGEASHAEGYGTGAEGRGSHSEGVETRALGEAAHAQGQQTLAVGKDSHAAGYRATALQNYTYAWSDGNAGTLTQNISSTRSGQFMISASGGVFIPGNVGIGTDSITNPLTVAGNISASGSFMLSLTSAPPTDTVTIKAWTDIYVEGVLYKMPLYQ